MKRSKILYRIITAAVWAAVLLLLWLQQANSTSGTGAAIFLVCIFTPTIAEVHLLSNILLPRVRNILLFWCCFATATLLTALTWGALITLLRTVEYWPILTGIDIIKNEGRFWQDALFALPSILIFNLGFCGLRLYFDRKEPFTQLPADSSVTIQSTTPPAKAGETIFIREGDALLQVRIRDILYVEGMQNYVKVHTAARTITTLQTLANMEKALPEDKFFRTHKSFIANMERIESISTSHLIINGKEIPVSPTRKEDMFARFVNTRLISK